MRGAEKELSVWVTVNTQRGFYGTQCMAKTHRRQQFDLKHMMAFIRDDQNTRADKKYSGVHRRQGTHSVTDGTQNRHQGDTEVTLCEDRDTHYEHIR